MVRIFLLAIGLAALIGCGGGGGDDDGIGECEVCTDEPCATECLEGCPSKGSILLTANDCQQACIDACRNCASGLSCDEFSYTSGPFTLIVPVCAADETRTCPGDLLDRESAWVF